MDENMKADGSWKLQTAQTLDFVLLYTQGPLNPINYYQVSFTTSIF